MQLQEKLLLVIELLFSASAKKSAMLTADARRMIKSVLSIVILKSMNVTIYLMIF